MAQALEHLASKLEFKCENRTEQNEDQKALRSDMCFQQSTRIQNKHVKISRFSMY
jgi:hypothetical protein